MVNWTAAVNEQLLQLVLKIPGLKLDLSQLATDLSAAIGEDVTPKALSHRIAKAKNLPSTNIADTMAPSTTKKASATTKTTNAANAPPPSPKKMKREHSPDPTPNEKFGATTPADARTRLLPASRNSATPTSGHQSNRRLPSKGKKGIARPVKKPRVKPGVEIVTESSSEEDVEVGSDSSRKKPKARKSATTAREKIREKSQTHSGGEKASTPDYRTENQENEAGAMQKKGKAAHSEDEDLA